MSKEECSTPISTKKTPLKALLLLTIFSLGSVSVSGTLLNLTVTDAHRPTGSFLLTSTPSSIFIQQGMNASSKITIMSIQGFAGTVTLTTQTTSNSISLILTPSLVTLTNGRTSSTVLYAQAAKNATLTTYNVVITGTSLLGKKILSSSTLVLLTVSTQADFSVYATPNPLIVTAGFSNTTNVIVESANGFDGTVSLSATTPFGFIGIMGGQNPVTVLSGTNSTSTLQVSTNALTSLGNYNITVIGTSGTVNHSCILRVRVVDPAPESLLLLGSSLFSPTSLSLSLHNAGNTPVTLVAYTVADSSGDSWTYTNWTGPVVLAGNSGQASLLIGSSCSQCTYSGVPFAFQQYIIGHNYTVTMTTKLNTQFTYTVIPA